MRALQDYEDFLATIKNSKKCQDQPSLITFLRERNYRFTGLPFLQSLGHKLKILKKHSKYIFMVRRYKETANPYNEGYDVNLLLGFRLDGTRGQVIIYIHRKHHSLMKLIWPVTHKMNIKKINKMRFPKGMTIEERFDWRKENYKYLKVKSMAEASEFYMKWVPEVIGRNPDHPVVIEMQKLIPKDVHDV